MTLKRVEDRPTPKEVYSWRPYLLALIAGWGGMLFGYDSAFIGGTIELPAFQAQFGLDKLNEDELAFTSSNIVSTYQAVPGGLLLAASIFLRETPRWLYRQKRVNEAIVNLSWMRNLPADHPYIQDEVQGIRAQFERETQGGKNEGLIAKLKELGRPGIRNRLGIGMCIMMCQNLTGMNAINYYSPTIFASIGITGTSNALFATGIYGVVKVAATLIALVWLVDRVGRRKPLIAGALVGALAMYYIAGFIAIAKPSGTGSPSPAGKFAAACIYIFAVAFCMSWNGISWIICSEIFPLGVRALGQTITSATQWLWQFVVARSTPYMIQNIGYGTYLFFGSCMILMIPWTYFILPETKGISLEDMDRLFGYCPHGDSMIIEDGMGKSEIEQREVADDRRLS
ncbi:unnamed protein product [Rhizoctonia solani]|uniref:Major facilitator superfamily (MFS) profile domain-containing protein n=1 Tax=Rhizoctonia solani TaxID=456999 RepID=A0A8H3DT10_9AGAM|nr:unnamed protein product [Rhizoctonia solani]